MVDVGRAAGERQAVSEGRASDGEQAVRESPAAGEGRTAAARAAYLRVKAVLEAAGIEDAAFEADALLRHTAGGGHFEIETLSEEALRRLMELAARRAAREPLQYILGSWPFLGLEIQVGPGVLIPRPETEELCLAAAGLLRGAAGAPAAQGAPAILDLCSGSGALALGLQSLFPAAHVTAVELDAGAYAWLLRNVAAFAAARGGHAPRAIRADALALGDERTGRGLYDLIVCNPPYVTEAEYGFLAPELRAEPKRALVPPGGGEDGLLFYRKIAGGCRRLLKPGGFFAFETGAAQGPAVRKILQEAGCADVVIKKDLAGHDRMALARRE